MDSSVLVIGSFAFYSLFIVAVGLWSSRHRKDTADDFVLANRELGPWAASLSASASSESGWVMLGLVGVAFSSGFSAFWIVPGIALGYFFNWFVLAEKLRVATKASGAVTLTQFISHRFGRNSQALRIVSVVIIVVSMLAYVAAQMNAAGKAFDALFELPYWLGVLAGAAIILAYTITGGFRAIAWTDIVQAGFMFIALVIMPFLMLSAAGGYGKIVDTLAAVSPDLLTWSGNNSGMALLGFIFGSLGIGLGYPGQPHVLTRFMAARSRKTVRQAGFISLVWMLVVYVGAIFFGMFARAHFGSLADPEQALPLACGELLPPVLAGFVVAAIVAAICSTADSQLMVVTSALSRDVFQTMPGDNSNGNNRKALWLDRVILIALGLVAVFLAISDNRVIFEFVLYAWAALGAAFGPVVILGLLWKRTSKAGALAGMSVGLLVTVIWRNIPILKSAVYELVPAFGLSLLAVMIFSLLAPEPSGDSRLQE
jgi:sodium/proline symporter